MINTLSPKLVPSLHPHALSRVVRCLCPTYFYTEGSTYRTLLFTPLMALRHCGEWASTSVVRGRRLLTNGDPCGVCRFPLTFILYHIFVDLSRGFQKFVQKFFYKVLWGQGLFLFGFLYFVVAPNSKGCFPSVRPSTSKALFPS